MIITTIVTFLLVALLQNTQNAPATPSSSSGEVPGRNKGFPQRRTVRTGGQEYPRCGRERKGAGECDDCSVCPPHRTGCARRSGPDSPRRTVSAPVPGIASTTAR
ncbi:hypothetical protein ACGFMK_27895 [Amycolatopsis sp. NPDC049252]|uniref:hypothetical protein n=1 Tax=Amycolatopsis sp. NPDC049252 TaxID=3363933 RepID=UPI00371FCDBF